MANTRHRRRNNGKRKQRSRRMRKRGGTKDDDNGYMYVQRGDVGFYAKKQAVAQQATASQATAPQATAPQARAEQHYYDDDGVSYPASAMAVVQSYSQPKAGPAQQARASTQTPQMKKPSPGDVGYSSGSDSENPDQFMGNYQKIKYETYEKRKRRRTTKPKRK